MSGSNPTRDLTLSIRENALIRLTTAFNSIRIADGYNFNWKCQREPVEKADIDKTIKTDKRLAICSLEETREVPVSRNYGISNKKLNCIISYYIKCPTDSSAGPINSSALLDLERIICKDTLRDDLIIDIRFIGSDSEVVGNKTDRIIEGVFSFEFDFRHNSDDPRRMNIDEYP